MNNRTIKFRAWQNGMVYQQKTSVHGIKKFLDLLYEDCILMQFTGLLDKNGKEIYEGDIVEWDDDSDGKYWRVAVVELFPALQYRIIKNSRHPLSAEEGHIFEFGSFIYKDSEKYIEVIGNIYEHNHLLQGKSFERDS